MYGQIVPDALLTLYAGNEKRDYINANHMEMRHLSVSKDLGYIKLRVALRGHINRAGQ